MNITALIAFVTLAFAKFKKADQVIKGITAENVQLKARLEAETNEKEHYKGLSEALQADNEQEAQALQDAIAKLEAVEIPELTPEETEGVEMNDPENPKQMQDEVLEEIIKDPEVELSKEDAPTVGTTEETPDEVIDAASDAVVDAIAGDESSSEVEPTTDETTVAEPASEPASEPAEESGTADDGTDAAVSDPTVEPAIEPAVGEPVSEPLQ